MVSVVTYFTRQFEKNLATVLGGDNWRRVRGSKRIAETKRWKTHCWNL